jgi:hypothetical protein
VLDLPEIRIEISPGINGKLIRSAPEDTSFIDVEQARVLQHLTSAEWNLLLHDDKRPGTTDKIVQHNPADRQSFTLFIWGRSSTGAPLLNHKMSSTGNSGFTGVTLTHSSVTLTRIWRHLLVFGVFLRFHQVCFNSIARRLPAVESEYHEPEHPR